MGFWITVTSYSNRARLHTVQTNEHASTPPVQTASLATFGGGVLTDVLAGLAANSIGLAKSFFRTREFRRDGLSYPLQAHSICPDDVFRFNYERPLCARSRHLATDRLLYLCSSVRRLTPFFEVNPQFRRLGQPLNHRSGRHCPEAPSWSRAGEELRRVMTRLARGPRAPTNRGRPWTLAPRDR